MSSDASSLVSRSGVVSLKTRPSTGLDPVTSLTVHKQSAHKNYLLALVIPTEFMARNVPDTPLVPKLSHVLSDLHDLPSSLPDTPHGIPGSLPLPSTPI